MKKVKLETIKVGQKFKYGNSLFIKDALWMYALRLNVMRVKSDTASITLLASPIIPSEYGASPIAILETSFNPILFRGSKPSPLFDRNTL